MKYNPHIHPRRDELYAIFKVTPLEALQPKIRLTKLKLKEYEKRHNKLLFIRIKAKVQDSWLPDMYLQELKVKIRKESKRLLFLNGRRKYLKGLTKEDGGVQHHSTRHSANYDKETAQGYKCRQILVDHNIPITPQGFFKIRNERTPSCKLYEESNSWFDHGSQEGGDSISLYMNINNCNFIEAVKELSI